MQYFISMKFRKIARSKKIIVSCIIAVILGGAVLYGLLSRDTVDENISPKPTLVPPTKLPMSPTPNQTPNHPQNGTVLHDVPFMSQAPLAQWDDPMFQDGCEEASILMAAAWAGALDPSRIASPKRASQEIVALSQYQLNLDGEFRDRSAKDTAQLMKQYFNYPHVRFVSTISANDIIHEITSGHVVIVPANGQALGNPNFTHPGPERHMLVIRGWDPSTNEFITNDPGTRNGEGYRYSKPVLYDAIRDYHTGYHIPIETVEKTMITVAKP